VFFEESAWRAALGLARHLADVLRVRHLFWGRAGGNGSKGAGARRAEETWGELLARTGHARECGAWAADRPSESSTLWVTAGLFSWMLSAPYAVLAAVPESVVTGFVRCTGLSVRQLFSGTRAATFRFEPGVGALADALAYGSRVRLGVWVGPIGPDKVSAPPPSKGCHSSRRRQHQHQHMQRASLREQGGAARPGAGGRASPGTRPSI